MTYRSEVVGSLLRPTYLVEARERHAAGQINAAEFKAIEDRAVNESIALQENAGIDVITDGEMRRYAFYGHLVEALEGFDKYGGWAIPFRDETGEQLVLKRPVVVERLKWRRSMCAEEWVYLRSRKSHPGKVTMISAQQAAAYYDPEKSKSAYPSRDAYLADIVDFSRREVEELVRLGCTYIQIDAPSMLLCSIPRCVRAIASVGTIPTNSSMYVSRWTMPSFATTRESPLEFIFAVVTTRANFMPVVTMNQFPAYLPRPAFSASFSNTTIHAREDLNR